MTTQVLHLPSDAGRWERLRHLARVPWHGLKRNGNQALITFAACFAAAMFSMQHEVFPVWVAVPLAIGFEWTYLAGIALAGDTRKGVWAILISITAMITSAAFGVLYILGVYKVVPEHPTGQLAVWLAIAHIVPITLMSFFYALAHRAHQTQWMADQDKRQERVQQREDTQQALTDQWRGEKLAIEVEREKLALEREKLALEQGRAQLASGMPIVFAPAPVKTRPCPKCGRSLSPQQYSNACRKDRGYCRDCRDE
jgi:hypothetical protein